MFSILYSNLAISIVPITALLHAFKSRGAHIQQIISTPPHQTATSFQREPLQTHSLQRGTTPGSSWRSQGCFRGSSGS